MHAMTQTTIRCALSNGDEAELTMSDCAEILNALARRRLLDVLIEDVPEGYSDIGTDAVFAVARDDGDDDEHEEGVALFAHAAEFTCVTPRAKKKAKRASR
jgi:hypothetical protein